MSRALPAAVPVASSWLQPLPWLGAVSAAKVQTTPQFIREVHS